MITEPGVYRNLDEVEYHRHPTSLSQSGAKVLLSNPAKFQWQREHPPEPTSSMNLGSAAHKLVLGVGGEIVVVEAADWRKKDDQNLKKNLIADGKIPLLPAEHETVQAMAERLRSSKIPNLLLSGDGEPEVSLFATDETTRVLRRARLDWLPSPTERMIIADYKTSRSADPERFGRSVADFGYHMQDAWYSDVVIDLGLAESVAFLFVVQETEPPYEVAIMQLDDFARKVGRFQNRLALDIFADCEKAGVWPGYGDGVHRVELPRWMQYEFEGKV